MVADDKGQALASDIGGESDIGGGDPPRKSSVRSKKTGGTVGVADALRVAYQETVREDVPDEFLDLLGKLA